MLALYPKLLNDVGLDSSFIKGCVSVSGVYDVSVLARSSHIVLRMIVHPAFGVSEDLDYSFASPIEYVNNASPPFLILNAEYDWGLERQAQHFFEKLSNAGIRCEWKQYHNSGTDHLSIIGLYKGIGEPFKEMIRDSINFFENLVAEQRRKMGEANVDQQHHSSVVDSEVILQMQREDKCENDLNDLEHTQANEIQVDETSLDTEFAEL